MVQKIKTNIKFSVGQNGMQSRLYGFVTKKNGSWRGCRESDPCKKKIVFVDEDASEGIIPNTLYSCVLIPMRNEGGFIAISSSIIKFKSKIETIISGSTYKVVVTFGNKNIVYDPSSRFKKENCINSIANMLRGRADLVNPMQVAEDFLDSACMVQMLYKSALKCSQNQ